MRLLPLLLALSTVGVLGSCTPTPPITVVHLGKNPVKKEAAAGDAVPLRRPISESYEGVRAGAYVVRSNEDWQAMWKGAVDTPAFPTTHDPAAEMIVVVATDDAVVSRVKITRAVETAELMTLFVRQTLLGEGCVRKQEERSGVDAVVATRLDKPLRFYIEDEDGESCGEAPKTQVNCRLGAAQTWNPKLTGKAGDVIECEQSTVANGTYQLVDQVLTMVESPPGSKAKLAYVKGSARAKFTLDVFGTYAIRAEATDEGGRRARATAFVEVPPKKTKDVQVQLTWADVDTADLTTPLPRVLLRVTQEGPRGQRCSAEVPVPGLCDAKARGSYTYMKIPASRRSLPLSVLYYDERAPDGPQPCVNVWFNGERTVAECDRAHRRPEDRWEIGTLETATGKITPPAPKPADGPAANGSEKPAAKPAPKPAPTPAKPK